MKRGEIYYAELDPTVGSEIKKMRPVIIVSNNISNSETELVTILPVTSKIQKIYPFEVFLTSKTSSLKKDSKVLVPQIRTISKLRIQKKKLGNLSVASMHQIDNAIKLHLALL